MNLEEALRFKAAVDRKLAAELISHEDGEEARTALARCVMGKKLCAAYDALYGNEL
jgi:hypothetical protein